MQQVQLHWRKNWLANNLLTYDRRTVWCGGFFIDDETGGQKNGKPVKATLKVEYNGKWDDGFAADYDGVYLVREVLRLE